MEYLTELALKTFKIVQYSQFFFVSHLMNTDELSYKIILTQKPLPNL